jgi:hypothetical protein
MLTLGSTSKPTCNSTDGRFLSVLIRGHPYFSHHITGRGSTDQYGPVRMFSWYPYCPFELTHGAKHLSVRIVRMFPIKAVAKAQRGLKGCQKGKMATLNGSSGNYPYYPYLPPACNPPWVTRRNTRIGLPFEVPENATEHQRLGPLLAAIAHMRRDRPYLWNHKSWECLSALWVWGYTDFLVPAEEDEQALAFANVPVRGAW